MNRKINSSIIIVILCILLSSCVPKDKEIVISKNVKGNADSTEIMTLVQEGTDYINMGKNDAAKSVFEKIIKKSKNNPEMYLMIKDKYIEANRLDDAYYFINLAIMNKVDVEKMKEVQKEISSKFEVVQLNDEVL